MQQINSTQYNELTTSDKLTIIKYAASWCGPCKMLTPIMDSVVKNYDINTGEVDIDQEKSLAINDGIRSVPTVLFFKNGKLLDRMVGVQPPQAYSQKIESLM